MYADGYTVIQIVESFAPRSFAVPDDRIGLQLGSLQQPVRKLLIALDVTDEVVEEAIRERVQLIVAHHAIIYRPLTHLRTDTPVGKLYEKLIKHDIAVYIAHTNLDSAESGMNDLMAQALGLTNIDFLESNEAGESFPQSLRGRRFGLGRVGKLPQQESLSELAERVKEAFDVPRVRVVGDLQRPIRKVAVLGGSGGRYVQRSLDEGADALVTGDIDYHTAHDAFAAGLAIIDPGHNAEKIFKTPLAVWLNNRLQEAQWETQAIASKVNTEIFRFL
jgi:dinuclear metal center YbgI/SA1388 family protein